MLTGTTFEKELVSLRVEINTSHTHKTGVWYLLMFPFKISDDHARQHPSQTQGQLVGLPPH